MLFYTLALFEDKKHITTQRQCLYLYNPTFLSYYAIFKSHLLKNKKAIELFDKATKYSPKDVNLLGNLAAAYQKIGDFKNSKKIFQKIININQKYINI